MNYHISPYLNGNIPDEALEAVWYAMDESGRTRDVFYQGSVTDPESWLRFCHDPRNSIIFVIDIDKKRVCCVAWLNDIRSTSAMALFCVLGQYSKGIGRAAMDFWQGLRRPDGSRALEVLIGMTPESLPNAIRLIYTLGGWKELGTIPKMVRMVYRGNELENLRISFCDLEERERKYGR